MWEGKRSWNSKPQTAKCQSLLLLLSLLSFFVHTAKKCTKRKKRLFLGREKREEWVTHSEEKRDFGVTHNIYCTYDASF